MTPEASKNLTNGYKAEVRRRPDNGKRRRNKIKRNGGQKITPK